MARRKMSCRKWTLVIFIVCACPLVCSRPSQETITSATSSSVTTDKPTENIDRASTKTLDTSTVQSSTVVPNASRDVKTKNPALGESFKMVTSQLLQNLPNASAETAIVADTRIPPKLKNQFVNKQKLHTTHEDNVEKENSHTGIAVPVTMEELESENKVSDSESSTSNEGISTWILLSNPTDKDNVSSPTEASKPEEVTKKSKPSVSKNKTKRPQQNNKNSSQKRPIIGSTNKSDLVAGGSAINENVLNKIKDTVLSNVQKNKHVTFNRTTAAVAAPSSTVAPVTPSTTTKKEVFTKAPSTALPIVKITSKPTKKKNKNKHKSSTTVAPIISESALLPMEPKEQEIELEISTPATTTKKPKRSSSKRKKNKNKKKSSKPLSDVSISETKTTNKTKSAKPAKKPNPLTTQIYNYLSREVMPSVGVGIVGLASLVGLAGYFLYPFSTPVRRTIEVDKKDDIYRHNAEEYANEGNGQAEEEMLGTVLAGMPANSKHKLNPYMGQTNYRYPAKKQEQDQNIRYRQVATKYESPNYSTQYQQNYQQKTGIAHAAVYSDPVKYNTQYETRHTYTTENIYPYESKNAYSYPAVEPIYAAPQTGPSGVSSYGNDASNAVVYGIKPSQDTEFKPVYPYEGKVYSETTSQSSITYPPTSMYLGSNNESDQSEETKYSDNTRTDDSDIDNKFVVGNVPKELVDNVTPAVVPEHGPRKLNRKRRSTKPNKRSIVTSIEDILKAVKEENRDLYLSNEIDEALGIAIKNNVETTTTEAPNTNTKTTELLGGATKITQEDDKTTVYPVYAVSVDSNKNEKESPNTVPTFKSEVIESISTLPIQSDSNDNPTTEPDTSNELDDTTKPFRVYEVFSSKPTTDVDPPASIKEDVTSAVETATEANIENDVTTVDPKLETSTVTPTAPTSQTKGPTEPTPNSTNRPKPTFDPNVITYPPYNAEGSFFTFIKRLFDFKYRLGMSILQTTSESLNRYLRSMENSVQKVSNGSDI